VPSLKQLRFLVTSETPSDANSIDGRVQQTSTFLG
jgi:hypothetical protein